MATAEWKKVIVSGSSAHLSSLQVGSNQFIGTTQATTSLTGSFSGSFVGSGANLSGVTATFPGTNLSPLLSTTRIFSNDGASNTSNTYVTAGQIMTGSYAGVSGDITISSAGAATIAADSVTLGTKTSGNYVATIDPGAGLTGGATTGEGVAHTLAVGQGTHITVNTDNVAVNTTTLTPAISGSIFTQVSGDISILAGGVSAIGSGVIVNADINANAAIADTKLDTIATALKVSNTATTATAANTANAIVARDGSGNFTAGTITANLTGNASGTAATVTGAAQTAITSLGTLTGLTVGGNATITGDLTVNGTTTILDTTNLSVEDRFIILNHGSGSVSPSAEGGIIVEGGAAGSGSAFFYDGDTVLRWGVALGVAEGATAIAANSYVVTVSGSNANPAGTPTYGGSTHNYGNMYVNTNDNTIWIFA